MKNTIKLSYLIFPLILGIFGCQTVNSGLVIEEPDFNLSKLKGKEVLISVPQVIENNIPKTSQLPFFDSDDFSKRESIDTDIQNLMVKKISENLDLFIPKSLSKSFILENNNGSKILIPIIKKDGFYKAASKTQFNIDEKLTQNGDYILIPLAIQLDDVRNINERYQSADLVEPGIEASISYVIYGINEKTIVISGIVQGVAKKSYMIDKSLGKDDVYFAVDEAIKSLVKEFMK
ncbi:MAG: hypothetical protein B6D44_10990 [Ignavibacteriales bacterium UTCHB2]|jgi:hypothetical protein|nr:MAG: hypothetical protein BWY38_02811 [Ignavibacteria bacterium ADurb.Bin266]OQY72084.1 MAG: hypothetical protein B6D44_10990 [Ignavibacteriales bacterium UTCHB2]HQI42139.1 hypothetical protein [Ignavibacteriaceae bacterium]